jgi:hypothetical protein
MTEGHLLRSPASRLARLIVAVAAASCLVAPVVRAAPSSAPALAAHDTGGPRWSELSPAHRKILAPLAADWNNLEPRSKERWIDVAGRFPKLPPEEQQRATQRMGEWAHTPVSQRQQARMNFQETRGVSPAEREARWKAYQALPDEKKRELAKRATPASAAASAVALARRRQPLALDVVQPKTNVIAAAPQRGVAGSAPAATPVRPGVTTPLLTRRATPPAHQPDGQPKIAAGPNAVDRKTLLPKRTTVASTAASAPQATHR